MAENIHKVLIKKKNAQNNLEILLPYTSADCIMIDDEGNKLDSVLPDILRKSMWEESLIKFWRDNQGVVPNQVIQNVSYDKPYVGSCILGEFVGLPDNINKIIYIPSMNAGGSRTQIAVGDTGNLGSSKNGAMFYRNSSGNSWLDWVDIRTGIMSEEYSTTDANSAIKQNGRPYYCKANCSNIPEQSNGILFSHLINSRNGYHLFFAESGNLWWRILVNGSFRNWESLYKGGYISYQTNGIHFLNNKQIHIRHIEGSKDGFDGNLFLNYLNRGRVYVPKPNTNSEVYDVGAELESLKQFAVSGKQTIINGINAVLNSNSGLSINSSWSDLDWWIRNKLNNRMFGSVKSRHIENGSRTYNISIPTGKRLVGVGLASWGMSDNGYEVDKIECLFVGYNGSSFVDIETGNAVPNLRLAGGYRNKVILNNFNVTATVVSCTGFNYHQSYKTGAGSFLALFA